jgi:succinate-semialdehyde dehydrogenase / glutarate-semialdehyde dehydrogenase
MILKSINPYDNSLIKEYEEYTETKVNELVKSSAIAFKQWRQVSFDSRAQLMKNTASLLRMKKEKYARTITLEMGKPIRESRAEVEKCAWVCEYFAENAEKHLKPEIIETDAQLSWVQYEPLGTILGIMPWNFPFWQVFRFLAPTIMAGNTALLKHASNVQGCALHIQDIMEEAGFPKDILNTLIIGSGKVNKVIDNELVMAVTLTGSEFAGTEVASLAGKNIKKSVLELGGSNAFIVLDDADIEKAVEEGIAARFMNCGQSCIASKRFIIHSSIAEQFIAKYKEGVEKLIVGNPKDDSTDLGPLVNIEQAIEVERQVAESIELGAKPLMDPKRIDAFFHPLILTHVAADMPVFKEEVFGPVAPIISFKTEEEAIELANKSRFGLGVTLFTTKINRAEQLIPKFDDGAVFINSLVKSDPRLPFGGTKKSGYGRELSLHGIREFVNVKTIYIS